MYKENMCFVENDLPTCEKFFMYVIEMTNYMDYYRVLCLIICFYQILHHFVKYNFGTCEIFLKFFLKFIGGGGSKFFLLFFSKWALFANFVLCKKAVNDRNGHFLPISNFSIFFSVIE